MNFLPSFEHSLVERKGENIYIYIYILIWVRNSNPKSYDKIIYVIIT